MTKNWQDRPMGRPNWNETLRAGRVTAGKRVVIELDDDRPAFEMQTADTPDAFALFVLFRDAGPTRKLKDIGDMIVAKELLDRPDADAAERDRMVANVRVRVSQKAAQYRWWERAGEYDRYLDRVAIDEQARKRREAVASAADRHAKVAAGLTQLGGRKLQKLFDPKDANHGEKTVGDMTIGELIAVIRSGIQMERLVLGIDEDARRNAAEPPEDDEKPDRPIIGLEEAKRIARRAAAEARTEDTDPKGPTEPPKPGQEPRQLTRDDDIDPESDPEDDETSEGQEGAETDDSEHSEYDLNEGVQGSD